MADVYQPSPDDLERAAQILAKLTPTQSGYEDYRLFVNSYVSMIKPALRGPEQDVLQGVRLRRSKLFADREYLVAYVSDERLQGIVPGYDAISSTGANQSGDGVGLPAGRCRGFPQPPFVFARRRSGSHRRDRRAGLLVRGGD